jgi:hypothetical protein
VVSADCNDLNRHAEARFADCRRSRSAMQLSFGRRQKSAAVFFAGETPLNPEACDDGSRGIEERRSCAEGAAQSTEGKESHLADVTACAADR